MNKKKVNYVIDVDIEKVKGDLICGNNFFDRVKFDNLIVVGDDNIDNIFKDDVEIVLCDIVNGL